MYRIRNLALLMLIASVAIVSHAAFAQSTEGDTKKNEDWIPIGPEKSVVTEHTITLNGRAIKYTATAATMHLKDDKDKTTGSLYYTAYTRPDVAAANRPIAFIYNGGPGSASMWLHMGAFGPKRIVVNPDFGAGRAYRSSRVRQKRARRGRAAFAMLLGATARRLALTLTDESSCRRAQLFSPPHRGIANAPSLGHPMTGAMFPSGSGSIFFKEP